MTVELGTRGEHGRFQWELSLYHSWLRNELLELNDAQGNDLGDVNVNRSYHQGIEASLDIELLRSVSSRKIKKGLEGSLRLNQTYTLNDFHFDGDPVFGNNRIAGIPVHVYEAELLYETANGFYAGPNLRAILLTIRLMRPIRFSPTPTRCLDSKSDSGPRKGFLFSLKQKI